MRYLLLIVVLSLTGCVSQRMNKGLDALIGRNIRYAISDFGYPTGQQVILGDTVYSWSTNGQVLMPTTTSTTTYGTVNGRSYSAVANSTSVEPVGTNCSIQLETDTNDTITHWHWEGNLIGCNRYARRLR